MGDSSGMKPQHGPHYRHRFPRAARQDAGSVRVLLVGPRIDRSGTAERRRAHHQFAALIDLVDSAVGRRRGFGLLNRYGGSTSIVSSLRIPSAEHLHKRTVLSGIHNVEQIDAIVPR
jgi:hypothetical protein